MRPVALYDELGMLYGYACGRCREMGGHGQCWGRGANKEPRKAQVRDSKDSAARCCSCMSCRRRVMTGTAYCASCEYWHDLGRAWQSIGIALGRGITTEEAYKAWLNDDDDGPEIPLPF